jgi:peptidoglycan/xylan/chitin deacetylase (PgdA/CDA1 family)
MSCQGLPTDICIRFPMGRTKALVMSYDDGSEHDRRLVDILNRYGIRASFHLNSGTLGAPHRVAPDELKCLYDGHEVSCHTVNHPDLTSLSDADIHREVADDRQTLESLVGMPVRGLAYPFGTFNGRVISVLEALDMTYARTIVTTQEFAIPHDFLALTTTCHHNQAMEVAGRFLRLPVIDEPKLLYVWGHSYEFDGFMSDDRTKDWRYIENFCRVIQEQASVYCTTTIQLVDYLRAAHRLTYAAPEQSLSNPTDIGLWVEFKGLALEIPARGCLRLPD